MKFSLDSYISFFESDDKSNFKVDFINQILHLHGFKKIHRTPKKGLVEAVQSIKLMSPSRMSLRQNIYSGRVISEDEANSDIKCLEWFECSNCSVNYVQSHNIHNEAITSTELVLYDGKKEDAPSQSNWNSTGKRPASAIHSPPVKEPR